MEVVTNYCPSVLDTVGWVIGPVKIVPDMTYNVFGGMLNPTLPIMEVVEKLWKIFRGEKVWERCTTFTPRRHTCVTGRCCWCAMNSMYCDKVKLPP